MGKLISLLALSFTVLISTSAQQARTRSTRTICFETNQGSFMNLDVSPDGKQILFDLLGDIYQVSSIGGHAKQLTRGTALHLRPVWSPDGKRFAFLTDSSGAMHVAVKDISTDKIHLFGVDDDPLSEQSEITWLNNGAFVSAGGLKYAVNCKKNISETVSFEVVRDVPALSRFYAVSGGKLYRYDQKHRKTLISSNSPVGTNVKVSPDGAYWSCLINQNSKQTLVVRRAITNDTIFSKVLVIEDPSGSTAVRNLRYAYSPDSRYLFMSYGGKLHKINLKTIKDDTVHFTASVNSLVAPFNYHRFSLTNQTEQVRYIRSVSPSPDGRKLVFTALSKIFVADADGNAIERLMDQPIAQYEPAWSPDGKWIAFVSWQDTAGGALWKVSATGGIPLKLSSISGQYQRPVWSPDGKLIAVVRGENKLNDRDDPGVGNLELWSAEGGFIKRLQDSIPLWNNLAFLFNGRSLYFSPNPDRRYGVYPQIASREVTNDKISYWVSGHDLTKNAQKIIEPSKEFIVYSLDEDLYLIPKFYESQLLSTSFTKPHGIRFAKGVDPRFIENGRKICWTYANEFYIVETEKIIQAAKRSKSPFITVDGQVTSTITVTITPEKKINLCVPLEKGFGKGMIVFKDARLLLANGRRVIEKGNIVINNGRFFTVDTGVINVPLGVRVIDGKGLTIMPGLVDLHDHMRLSPDVFPNQSWMYLANLAYGVTTARDPSSNYDSFGYKELLESGQMIGPRLFTAGKPAGPNHNKVSLENLDDAIAYVHKRKMLGGTVVKQYLLPNRQQRKWMVQAAEMERVNITNEGGEWLAMLAMIKDGNTGIEHSPASWGDVYNDVVTFIAKSGTFITPTLQVSSSPEAKEYFKYKFWRQPDKKLEHFIFSEPSQRGSMVNSPESIETIRKSQYQDTLNPSFTYSAKIWARISRAGGRVGVGSHGENQGFGMHNEMWALQSGGLTNLEALCAATIMGAEALGVQRDLGSIEVGKIADLVILNSNPLDDIHNSRDIKYIMKDGVLYNGDTLDQIWPKQVKCPEWKLKDTPIKK